MASQPAVSDLDDRYGASVKADDPLEREGRLVNFEAVRYRLDKGLKRGDGAKGGRPSYDSVLMFKILMLQAFYNLSDDRVEFLIRDRLSFMRLLGTGMAERTPDATTIWLFHELLTEAGATVKLFAVFDTSLKDSGYSAMSGRIIDASLLPAPRQRNTEAEKDAIKGGQAAAKTWSGQSGTAAQKGTDGRWTVKVTKAREKPEGVAPMVVLAIPTFGYKKHIEIGHRHGLIRSWTVSDAARHAGAQRIGLLDKTNTAPAVWADTADQSKTNEAWLVDNGMRSCIPRKKPRSQPMLRRTGLANAAKSRVRSAIENVFARQNGPMGLFVRISGNVRGQRRSGWQGARHAALRLA